MSLYDRVIREDQITEGLIRRIKHAIGSFQHARKHGASRAGAVGAALHSAASVRHATGAGTAARRAMKARQDHLGAAERAGQKPKHRPAPGTAKARAHSWADAKAHKFAVQRGR